MEVDLEELAAIIEQLDKTEFTEFSYEHGDLRIQVRRGQALQEDAASFSVPESSPKPSSPRSHHPEQETSTATTGRPEERPPGPEPVMNAAAQGDGKNAGLDPNRLPEGHALVTAPMLGTFYSAPKPGEAPFVSVGDSVEADSVVCIVEVMKLMNSVPAGQAGEVAAVFASSGQMIEHGEPLFALKVS